MSLRIAGFNSENKKELWVFQPVNLRNFRVGGRDVSLIDSTTPQGDDLLTLTFGDHELKLSPSVKPGNPALPGLARHAEWLRVLRFADRAGRSFEEFQAHIDEGHDRIVVVARRPLTGPDPRTGDFWQKDWMFNFYELLPDGTISTDGLRFPKTRGGKTAKPGELIPGTWQMEAALHLMPNIPPDSLSIGRPTAAFRKDAMRSLGWTLPASSLSACGLIACIALAAAPRRSKPDRGGGL